MCNFLTRFIQKVLKKQPLGLANSWSLIKVEIEINLRATTKLLSQLKRNRRLWITQKYWVFSEEYYTPSPLLPFTHTYTNPAFLYTLTSSPLHTYLHTSCLSFCLFCSKLHSFHLKKCLAIINTQWTVSDFSKLLNFISEP